MKIMIRLEAKNYDAILKEKLQKYQHYHEAELLNMNIMQVRKYCFLIKIP